MPRKERLKRLRAKQLKVAASGIPKINTFGFHKALSEIPSQDLRSVEGTPSSSNEIVETNIDSDEFDITPQADSTHIPIATDECQFPPQLTIQQHDFETCDAFPESFDLTETDTSAESKIGCATFECQAGQTSPKSFKELSCDAAEHLKETNEVRLPETSEDISTLSFCSSVASNPSMQQCSTSTTCELAPEDSCTTANQSLKSGCQAVCCTQNSPYKPSAADLKETSVKQTGNDGKIRQCPLSIFSKYNWVTYCLTRGCIACFFCKTVAEKRLHLSSHHTEKAFSSGEFSNWKKCYEKLEKHQGSNSHKESIEKYMFLNDANTNVAAQLDKQHKDQQSTRRFLFLKQLSSLKYLLRQGLAIRGRETLESNLIQQLKTRSEDVPELSQWIENGQYLSSDIINELIEMMGNAVVRSILEDVKANSGLFGLIADESRDISNKEQLTCVLRWVSLSDLVTHEDCIGMYLIEKPDAETIAASLKDVLLRSNLRLIDCRWQAYDGAATMSGRLNGVGARLQAENPKAHRIHCANHRLDLALKSCANQTKVISDTLTFVQDLGVFIRHSPLRMSTYQSIAKDLEPDETVESLHLLCPTRWTVRTKSISAVLNNYQSLYSTLVNISENARDREIGDKAAGLADKLTKFKTFFGLHFAMNIFSVCEQLATTLQKKGILAQTVMTGVNALRDNLQRQRNDYDFFFEQTIDKANALSIVCQPVLPRPKKVPRRLQHGNSVQHQHDSPKSMFRAQYYEAIDACQAELARRFDESSYAPLQHLEDIFLNAANGEVYEINDDIRTAYGSEIDFDQVTAELKLLPSIIKQCLPDVKQVTTIDTVVSAATHKQNAFLLSNVIRLLQVYLLAPMSAATAERSFSTQRRIKNYLRNNMTEKRYNNVLVLNMHKERTDEIDLAEIAKVFSRRNDRRMRFFGKF